ncbi:MAG TPA: hypothetical protein VFZ45_01345 [Actinomycetota bacterium]|nr:hypothetical protein [Actinomycetota bacterium]
MDRKLLGIYLNDHLAGAMGGIELARRCLSNNRGTPLEADLEKLAREIEEDRVVLEGLMERLRIPRSPVKAPLAWALEKVGRLKLNGRLLEYSPLSRVVELELLSSGVETKRSMWTALKRLADEGIDLGLDLEDLIGRARRQRRMLERRRLEAAAAAFA